MSTWIEKSVRQAVYSSYAHAHSAAVNRAKAIGVEVAIRQHNLSGAYMLQHRYELPQADTKLVAIARPEIVVVVRAPVDKPHHKGRKNHAQ